MKKPLLLLLLTAACDSPSLSMQNVPATRVEVSGMTFAVRRRDERAEAMRVSRHMLPSKRRTLDAGARAIEQATGCDANRIEGDQAIILARLDCPKD